MNVNTHKHTHMQARTQGDDLNSHIPPGLLLKKKKKKKSPMFASLSLFVRMHNVSMLDECTHAHTNTLHLEVLTHVLFWVHPRAFSLWEKHMKIICVFFSFLNQDTSKAM